MEYLRDIGIGDFYWDYYAPTLQDSYNKAAFFLNDNKRRFPSKIEMRRAYRTNASDRINIDTVGCRAGKTSDRYTSKPYRQ